MNIVETAASDERLSTLVSAIQAAGLADVLASDEAGPFTVFAPTNEAFAKLPEGTLETLLSEEGLVTLKSILTYHVVKDRVPAVRVVGADSLATLQGESINVRVSDAGVTINEANVTATDVHCSNGLIHVIDTVLIP
jgi:uncharacterized surface protein with fasciclin (FAS1) repeats